MTHNWTMDIYNKNLSQNLNRLRQILSTQQFINSVLQPNKRSYSQPDLSSELVGQFVSLRQFLNDTVLKQNDTTQLKENSKTSEVEKNEENRPVPKPRRHRQRQHPKMLIDLNSKCDNISLDSIAPKSESSQNANTTSSTSNQASSSLVSCETINKVKDADTISNNSLSNPFTSIAHSSISQYVELPTIKRHSKKIKTKGQSFKESFMKINKLATNKFLSIRISKELIRKKLNQQNEFKPRRPIRSPPPTPILIFRAAAPTPSDTDSDFELDTMSELYHDSMQPEEASEGIYCSLDEESSQEENEQCNHFNNQADQSISLENDNVYEGVSELYAEGTLSISTNTNEYDETPREENDYYDDGECIYEELSSNEGTVYEEYFEDDYIYDNVEAIETKDLSADDKKQIKRLKKIQKKMKQFKMNGNEIPVNAGIVKEDNRGSRNGDLYVKKGETVLILRISTEKDPPGKWLAKNERSKIGYVDLDNLYFDAESIKAVIKSFQNA